MHKRQSDPVLPSAYIDLLHFAIIILYSVYQAYVHEKATDLFSYMHVA